jgi:hypothetical protein
MKTTVLIIHLPTLNMKIYRLFIPHSSTYIKILKYLHMFNQHTKIGNDIAILPPEMKLATNKYKGQK